MQTKKLLVATAVGLALLWTTGPASAALADWSFEDDDIDFILDSSGNQKTSGALTPGDIFVSVFEWGQYTINGANAIPAGQEVTGLGVIELLSISGAGPGAQYVFGPYAGINTLPGLNGVLPNGSALAMWTNGAPGPGTDRDLDLNRTTNPATNCTSITDCIDQATRGTLLQVDGFGLDPDEFWASTQVLPGGGDIGTVLNTNNNVIVAAFNYALSNLYNSTGTVEFIDIATGLACGAPGYIADGCVQFSGSGTITGGQGLVNGAIAHSDADGQKYVAVPEPSTLFLFGASLLGLGRRMRRSKP
jgi:hypothetical protein